MEVIRNPGLHGREKSRDARRHLFPDSSRKWAESRRVLSMTMPCREIIRFIPREAWRSLAQARVALWPGRP